MSRRRKQRRKKTAAASAPPRSICPCCGALELEGAVCPRCGAELIAPGGEVRLRGELYGSGDGQVLVLAAGARLEVLTTESTQVLSSVTAGMPAEIVGETRLLFEGEPEGLRDAPRARQLLRARLIAVGPQSTALIDRALGRAQPAPPQTPAPSPPLPQEPAGVAVEPIDGAGVRIICREPLTATIGNKLAALAASSVCILVAHVGFRSEGGMGLAERSGEYRWVFIALMLLFLAPVGVAAYTALWDLAHSIIIVDRQSLQVKNGPLHRRQCWQEPVSALAGLEENERELWAKLRDGQRKLLLTGDTVQVAFIKDALEQMLHRESP